MVDPDFTCDLKMLQYHSSRLGGTHPEIMRRIKGRSSRKLFEEFPAIKKQYWGKHFWARGYFCATVGQMTEEMVSEYLEHHFEPNKNDKFNMTQ